MSEDLIIDKLYLALQTRDENEASTTEYVRLFSEGEEIARFNELPPPRGKAALLEAPVSLSYSEIVSRSRSIGLTGVDKWGPRAVFLWGRTQTSSIEYVPLAHLPKYPYCWISQDVDLGIDRLPLSPLWYLPKNGEVMDLVLCVETACGPKNFRVEPVKEAIQTAARAQGVIDIDSSRMEKIEKTIAGIRFEQMTNPSTTGPIEFSVFAVEGASSNQRWMPLAFHTVLTQIGQQGPADAGGFYLAHFANACNVLKENLYAMGNLKNKSDNPWKPTRIFLFGIGGHLHAYGRILAVIDNFQHWVGQNPCVSESLHPIQQIPLYPYHSTLDNSHYSLPGPG